MTTEYNWDAVAEQYRRHRPGPPASYYNLLGCFGLGQPGQLVLDIGTGTGQLACTFAGQGARVVGIDKSRGQIEQAKIAGRAAGLDLDFLALAAEDLPRLDRLIDLAVANMCWFYLDAVKVLDRLIPQLSDQGRLAISTLRWLETDPVGAMTAAVIADQGVAPRRNASPLNNTPRVDDPRLRQFAGICYEELIPFDLEDWVGRQLAGRRLTRVGSDVAARVARALRERLLAEFGERFSIAHGIEIQIFGLSA